MKTRVVWFAVLWSVGVGCSDTSVPPWGGIREELLAMERRDQAVREGLTGASLGDTALFREMLTVDSAHTERMKTRVVWFAVLWSVGAGCGDTSVPPWGEIREELLAMEQRDQAVREGLTGASLEDTALLREMLTVDSAHTERLREIVETHGWPGISDVGTDGAGAVWLLLQHSPDTAFQRETLPLMEEAAERGEASHRSLALLTDRVLIRQGKPQLYGTQFRFVDGGLAFHPIEDSATVDERRATVGLPPLEEYRRMSEEFYELGGRDTLRVRSDSL